MFFKWTGRDDGNVKGKRIYQVVQNKKVHDIKIVTDCAFGLVGFECEEGVRRNKGRLGAAKAPNQIRKSLASIPYHANKENIIDVGNVTCDGNKLEEAQKKLEDKHPYYSFSTVEAGTYEGQEEDFVIGSIDLITYTHEDTPGILIEEYLNGILENREAFEQVHGTAKDINADTIAEDMLLPLHPAAEEYYKQAGIITE